MIISLDYDDTYTRDPAGWDIIIDALRGRGHTVYGVTMRYIHEKDGMDKNYLQRCDDVFFTGRKAKHAFMAEQHGVIIDVWIDDQPGWVLQDAL